MQRVSNHPVHMHDKDMKQSPSSFIPFCAYGKNMSAMGMKNNQFELPVCNSFKPKILNEQLCYETSIERLNKYDVRENLKEGLVFFLDYNEDRQIKLDDHFGAVLHDTFVDKVDESKDYEKAFIHLHTICE